MYSGVSLARSHGSVAVHQKLSNFASMSFPDERKFIQDFQGNVVGGCRGQACYVSFPGQYADKWEALVNKVHDSEGAEWSNMTSRAAGYSGGIVDPNAFKSACVFLQPGGRSGYGHHCYDVGQPAGHHTYITRETSVTMPGKKCYCHFIYGAQKPWGCNWFNVWCGNVGYAKEQGMVPHVVYWEGQVGQGDNLEWDQLASGAARAGPGLGASQKAEVAYLKKIGWWNSVKKVDVGTFASAQSRTGASSRGGGGFDKYGGGQFDKYGGGTGNGWGANADGFGGGVDGFGGKKLSLRDW